MRAASTEPSAETQTVGVDRGRHQPFGSLVHMSAIGCSRSGEQPWTASESVDRQTSEDLDLCVFELFLADVAILQLLVDGLDQCEQLGG